MRFIAVFVGAAALCLSFAADAYIGPGAGIGVLGSLLSVIAAVFIGIFAILLWPIRRMMKKKKAARAAAAQGTPSPESTPAEVE